MLLEVGKEEFQWNKNMIYIFISIEYF